MRRPPATVIEDAAWLARTGETAYLATKRLGYKNWDTLDRTLARLGRGDIAKALSENSRNRGLCVRTGLPLTFSSVAS